MSPLKRAKTRIKDPIQSQRIQITKSNQNLPVRHGGDGFKRLQQPTLRIAVTILPPP